MKRADGHVSNIALVGREDGEEPRMHWYRQPDIQEESRLRCGLAAALCSYEVFAAGFRTVDRWPDAQVKVVRESVGYCRRKSRD